MTTPSSESSCRASGGRLSLVCVLLAMALAGVLVLPQQKSAPPAAAAVITGDLEVDYNLITLKTASTEEASGGSIDAVRVEYFPNYVLVTSTEQITMLWPVDRLKRFQVKLR